MAPPKTYNEANPAIVPFERVYETYTDLNGNLVIDEDFRPPVGSGYEILPDDVLNSGNLELLYNYRSNNQDILNDPKYLPAKRYLDARIKNAERIQAYEDKSQTVRSIQHGPAKADRR